MVEKTPRRVFLHRALTGTVLGSSSKLKAE